MTNPADGAPLGRMSRWPKWLTASRAVGALKTAIVKPAVTAVVACIVTALVVGSLRDLIDHRLVPAVLEYTHQELDMHLYPVNAAGEQHTAGEIYALFLPTSGMSRNGRMIERLETTGLNSAYDYIVSGSVHDGMMTFHFRRFDGQPGGGTFIGLSNRKGYMIGLLTGLAHDDQGGTCKIAHYLAVIGRPANAHLFTAALKEAIKVSPWIVPAAAVQKTEFTNSPGCGLKNGMQKTADDRDSTAAAKSPL